MVLTIVNGLCAAPIIVAHPVATIPMVTGAAIIMAPASVLTTGLGRGDRGSEERQDHGPGEYLFHRNILVRSSKPAVRLTIPLRPAPTALGLMLIKPASAI
jgi:hypothetical protein